MDGKSFVIKGGAFEQGLRQQVSLGSMSQSS